MIVKDAMTTDVELASPTHTIRQAALLMGKNDCGALPVADKDLLVGMITDRDIAIRAIAAGRGPRTLVRDIRARRCSTASRIRISKRSAATSPTSRCGDCR